MGFRTLSMNATIVATLTHTVTHWNTYSHSRWMSFCYVRVAKCTVTETQVSGLAAVPLNMSPGPDHRLTTLVNTMCVMQ